MSQSVQRALDRLMRRPLESLIVIIGLNEACNIFADCLATIILLAWLGDKWAPIVAAPMMLVVVLLFCDITPKTFALGFPGSGGTDHGAAAGGAHRSRSSVRKTISRRCEEAPRPDPVSEAEFKALLRLGENQGRWNPPSAR